ncbi:MAG: ATP synthase F0 subunit B [Candidatus Woykebacteria bacterium GWB1_45_5]|uniref:ATP synthase subunit b n=2 Tax=Candidatus Woykeibacteriota TaxID=1817899 RepID=A0A1G1W0J8_9BACT|nr:MAG: ATP synthase F0 subunit B [Candidatus Woykebacteria bacterium GWA1_44_8]OGY24715.1 MAG: ATP synthase F0 subunit B [Candidatus Woykebacteria bacterium GWB1_45_5]
MEILKDFGVQPILLLAQIVNFAILLYLLKRFLYKPILKVLEERRQKVETSMKQAEEMQKRFEETTKKQEEILGAARSDASKVIEDAKEEAKALAETIQKESKEATEATIKRAQGTLELEKQKMIAEARSQIVEIVTTATEKVVAKTLKGSEKERLIEESIKEIQG